MGNNLPPVDLGTCGSSACTAKQVVAGSYHTCVILNDDTVKCWGDAIYGQPGYGDKTEHRSPPSATVDLGTGKTAKQVGAGYYHTCAILNDDTVKCWGWNLYGQLGYGNNGDSPYDPVVYAYGDAGAGQATCDDGYEMGDCLQAVDLGTCGSTACTAKQVTSGHYHNCVLLNDDTVKCWGRSRYGELGYGDQKNRGDTGAGKATCDEGYEMGDCLPTVDLGTCGSSACTVKQIVASKHNSYHTCAILNDDSLKCWEVDRIMHSGMVTPTIEAIMVQVRPLAPMDTKWVTVYQE